MVSIRRAGSDDADCIATIYNQGIEERSATFETEPRTAQDRRRWLETHPHHPAVVAEEDGVVIAFAGGQLPGACVLQGRRRVLHLCGQGFSRPRDRQDASCGLGRGGRKPRILETALPHLHLQPRQSSALRGTGFREVGVYEKYAKLDERWIDCVIVERLIPENM